MPTQEFEEQREIAELTQSVDDSRDPGDPFLLSSETRTTLNTRLANAVATDAVTSMAEGDRATASGNVRTALENLDRLLHDGYNHIKAVPSFNISDADRLGLFTSYGWSQGLLGRFGDDRIESLANQAVATTPTVSDPAWRYPDALMTAITTELATLNANQPLATTGSRQQAIDNRDAALESLRLINARVRFFYCSASDLVDTTPELARIGRQPRRGPGSAGEGGESGSELQTARYNTAIVGIDTEVTIEVPAELVDIQTLKLVHQGTEFFTAFSPMPGTTVKTTWPGMAISGAIDEVKIQNGQGEDIAEGIFDPTLPDPGP